MPPTKNRIIYCERNVSAPQGGLTLQQALARALRLRPTVEDTRMPLRAGQAEIRHRDERAGLLYIHIAAWTENEPMSTVPHPSPPPTNADLDEELPGSDWDFLDGDGMVLVAGDHCLIMPSGLHKGTIVRYLSNLLSANGLIRALSLVPLTRTDRAKVLREKGIKRIRLNLGQYAETARTFDAPQTIVQQVTSRIWESLITDPADLRAIAEAQNVTARLVISIDRRRQGLTHETFEPLASTIMDEDAGDIEIETPDGQKIRSGELILKEPADVLSYGKTIHHNDAWEVMTEFLARLERTGALSD